MKHWYVLKTKPKKEKTVKELLAAARYEIFLPLMKGLFNPKPLFPSYLFIHADFSDPTHHRTIRFTRGVNQILGDGQGPHPVNDLIVETLRERTADGSIVEQELIFKDGDQVRVKRGMLRDLAGIIEKNISAAGRVRVLFNWMSGSMRAVFRYTELERVT